MKPAAPPALEMAAWFALLTACAPAQPPAPPPLVEPPARPAPSVTSQAPAAPAEDPSAIESRTKVREMLERVSRARGLAVRHEVTSRVLDRAGVLARIRANVEKEIPRDAVENDGELLAALELVPADYDFVEGTYRLIEGRIAGFYEPADQTMYLVDDLTEEEAIETLAHELDHALQDQWFSLGAVIEYAPGDGDRTAAAHCIIEGDAMSAMLDVVLGSAFGVSEKALRALIAVSNATSDVAKTTPHILQASLAAPYTDGFAFVQRERSAGGWPRVDAALRSLPASTEQILHADKYASREPPVRVAVPPFAALGPGFRKVNDDVIGEQGLLLMLEEWVPAAQAARGAAGWGGDRYVIARRDDGDARTIAVGWRAVMDTERDARELAEILAKRFGRACRERTLLGPIEWRQQGKVLVLAAGPYVRKGKATKQAGSCAQMHKWIEELLR
jgi:hypothetical protein